MTAAKTTWHHLRRSPYQAFAAVFIIFQTFFVVSLFTFLILGSAQIISYFESLPQVNAFFRNEAQKEDIDALKAQLEANDKVANVTYISQKEALKIYTQQNKDDDPLLLELVSADTLPASLEISTINVKDLSGISETLKNSPLVYKVVFQKDIIAKLTTWTEALRKIGIGLIAVFAIDSILIMIIIIGIKISQRKDEIEIMRLLGATNWYVRWPFIYEGMFYGVIGAFFGWLFASVSLWYATPFLSSVIGNIPILPISPFFFLQLLGVELLLAVLLGAFSSFIAVLRYLK